MGTACNSGRRGQTQSQQNMRQTQEKIDQLLERILDTNSVTVIAAYEKKITELERTKLLTTEKLTNSGENKHTFDEMFELALGFLSNPWKLWESGNMNLGKIVLRLAFLERPSYIRENGFLKKSFPFKALYPNFGRLKEMVLLGRIELPTSSLPMTRSTTELQQHDGRFLA